MAPSDFHNKIVGTVQAFALVVVRHNGNAAVGFLSRNPTGIVLTRQQPALRIASQAVGLVGAGLEKRQTVGIVIAHPPILPDVAEQQVATFLEPDRAFRRPPG